MQTLIAQKKKNADINDFLKVDYTGHLLYLDPRIEVNMAHSPYEIGPFTLNDRSCQAASLFQHTMSYCQSSHLGARSGNR